MTYSSGAKRLIWRFARPVYRRLQKPAPQEFSIGIAIGDSPCSVRLPKSIANPVLTREDVTDVPATLVADPFMCQRDGRWYLFFEVVNHLTRRGEIGVAVSPDAEAWEYERIVLAEPYHLSYPYVFEWQGSHYMIPESGAAKSVRLYRAARVSSPLGMGRKFAGGQALRRLVHSLSRRQMVALHGHRARQDEPAAAVVFRGELLGPWHEHPSSPLRDDQHFSRPAGRVVVADRHPVRFAQDVYPVYGSSVSAFAVTKLTPTEYEERR